MVLFDDFIGWVKIVFLGRELLVWFWVFIFIVMFNLLLIILMFVVRCVLFELDFVCLFFIIGIFRNNFKFVFLVCFKDFLCIIIVFFLFESFLESFVFIVLFLIDEIFSFFVMGFRNIFFVMCCGLLSLRCFIRLNEFLGVFFGLEMRGIE